MIMNWLLLSFLIGGSYVIGQSVTVLTSIDSSSILPTSLSENDSAMPSILENAPSINMVVEIVPSLSPTASTEETDTAETTASIFIDLTDRSITSPNNDTSSLAMTASLSMSASSTLSLSLNHLSSIQESISPNETNVVEVTTTVALSPSSTTLSINSSLSPASSNVSSSDTVIVIPTNTLSSSLSMSSTVLISMHSSSLSATADTLSSSLDESSSVLETSSVLPSISTSSIQSTSTATTPGQPTSSSTPTPTPTPSPSQSTKPPTHHTVKISETNIFLVKPNQLDTMFVELSGAPNESLDGVFLTIRNAKVKDDTAGILQFIKLAGNLDTQGLFIVDKSQQLNLNIADVSSVLIALYSDETLAKTVTKESLLNNLLYSVDPGSIDSEVDEVYQSGMANHIYVNTSMLDLTPDASLSMCSGNKMGSGFVLATATKNQSNQCALDVFHKFQMKLTLHVGKKNCLASHLPNRFENLLTEEIVTRVNEHRQCGLSCFNIEAIRNQARCIGGNKVIAVDFDVKSAFDNQIGCIKMGYESFTAEKGSVHLDGSIYLVSNCSSLCFPNAVPASESDDDNMKVTVAVVISCIGVFLVILLAVIIYMKRKRRGLLQFRMTRLDEDDDDLVGDMDDFVGNQGATFSNFR